MCLSASPLACGAQQGLRDEGQNSLPFMPACAVRPGWSCSTRTAPSTLSNRRAHRARPPCLRPRYRAYAQLRRERDRHPQLDLRLPRRRHQQHPRLRARLPRRASIALEQNYRSTNSILGAANSVIENNRERKPKRLFSDLGAGDPVQVVEVEDEHTEARFVAAEIARLVETGCRRARSPSSTGRTHSAACSRTCSCGRTCPTR